MKKKKVLIVAGVFPPEPIVSANLLYELAIELSKRYSITVLRPRPTRPLGYTMSYWDTSSLPFKVVILDSFTYPESRLIGRFRESYSMGKAVVKYIDKNHGEIDFIFNDAWHLFGVNMVAKAAVKYGIKYITPVQDIYPESLVSKIPNIFLLRCIVKTVLLPIDKYNLKRAAKIHTISEKMVEILSKTRGLPKDKFVVVRNWQDDKQFTDFISERKLLDSEKGDLTLMYLGNVGYLAGLEVVIDAVKSIPDQNLKFIIAGSGAAKNNLMKRAVKDARISFIDVPAGAVPATQDMADIMILPVRRGFALSSIPSKLPAYMFSAKPVLASVDSDSDTAKCIIDSGGGWVVKPESVEQLALQIEDCMKIPRPELSKIGKRGREYALKNLSRDKNLSALVNVCIEVIEQ